MAADHPNVRRIIDFNFDAHDEETLKRLCLEVPCSVDLTFCNVVHWFDRQVARKREKSSKWDALDASRKEVILRRKGAFLYEKYLEQLLPKLPALNRSRLRYVVWFRFRREHDERQSHSRDTEFSINTIFDTDSLADSDRSLLSISPQSEAIAVPSGSCTIEFDLDHITTSTQNWEAA